MDTINLKVTSSVLSHTRAAENQKQIAISNPTGKLMSAVSKANRDNRINLLIAARISLVLGDTGAIWKTQYSSTPNIEYFDNMFSFLENYPDVEFSFICDILE